MLKYWLYKLDDVRLRRKLLLLYLLCIFLPMLVTNSVFIRNAIIRTEQQKIEELNNSLRRIELTLKRSLIDVILVSHLINSDKALFEYLDMEYGSIQEYVAAYQGYLRDALAKYRQIYGQIQEINMYSHNKTIPATSNYKLIDSNVTKALWYRKFIENKSEVLVMAYVEDGNNYFSVISQLNNFKPASQDARLLKIDIRLTSFRMISREENINGQLYLINSDNEIVFSAYDGYLNSDESGFVRFDEEGLRQDGAIVVKSPFEGINLLEGYSVVGVIDRSFINKALKDNITMLVVMSLSSLMLATAIILLIASSLTYRMNLLSKHLLKSGSQEFDTIDSRTGGDEIGELIRQYNAMQNRIRELITDVYKADIQKKALELERKQAELNALHSQLNPHFLFNTLSTIHMRSMINDDKETAEVVLSLSDILKRLTNWEKEMVTVQEELCFIEEYLKIQKYRFGDKIEYQINAAPETLAVSIPMMCYQVFVENACVHGIETAMNKRFVHLDVEIREGRLWACISDNGVGIDENALSKIMNNLKGPQQGGKSIGIKNVYRRLQLLYGNRFRFHMESGKGGGCRVYIEIELDNPREDG